MSDATPLTRMRVDFNARVRDGLVRGSEKRVIGGAVVVGQTIAVYDDDGLWADAEVVEVDPDSGRVLLAVDWGSCREVGLTLTPPVVWISNEIALNEVERCPRTSVLVKSLDWTWEKVSGLLDGEWGGRVGELPQPA